MTLGGTFTDVVVTSTSGDIYTYKLLSTPQDFSDGVVEGIREIIESHGVEPAGTRDVVHGSTVATNAILERKGALTGLLTTAGFADVLELRRLRVPKLYDVTWQKPEPLVERSMRLEIIERVGVDGQVVTALDLDDARQKVEALVEIGVESIAVCLIHSYANSSHETAIGEMLAREYPDVWDLTLPPGVAGDSRVRADQHDGAQRLRQAGGGLLPGSAPREARRLGRDGAIAHHAVQRRRDDQRSGRRATGIRCRVGSPRRE